MQSICFVNDFFIKDEGVVTTGPMVQMYLIGKELAQRGWQVSHVVSSNNNKTGLIEKHDGMSVHYIRSHKYGSLFEFRNLYRIFKKINSDVYYQRGRSFLTGLVAFYARLNKKLFVWSSAGETGMAKWKYSRHKLKKKKGFRKALLFPLFILLDTIYHFGIRNADVVFAQTEYQLNSLKQGFGRLGIVFRSGHPLPPSEHLNRPNLPVVLWIGALKAAKQPDLFLRLAKELSKEKADFVMIGRLIDPIYKESLQDQQTIQANFRYKGEIPFEEMPDWYSKASIVVNTTLDGYEGLPNVFIQSWLHGVPVVSLYSDPDDVIKKYHLGYCVGSFDALVEKVQELIRDEETRNELGSKAQDFALKEFELTCLVDKFVGILLQYSEQMN